MIVLPAEHEGKVDRAGVSPFYPVGVPGSTRDSPPRSERSGPLTDWMLNHEVALRFGCFFGVFAVMVLWELVASRRTLSQSRGKRWLLNLSLSALSSLTVRILFPAAAVGASILAEDSGWGLFNLVQIPRIVAIALSVAMLDLAIYLQHVMFHAVPLLWRLHMVHHSDQDFDVTTGIHLHRG